MNVKDHKRSDKIHFYNLGLGDMRNEYNDREKFKMLTFSSVRKLLGHTQVS